MIYVMDGRGPEAALLISLRIKKVRGDESCGVKRDIDRIGENI